MSNQTVLYKAKRILTMNPEQPSATHVAVRDGKIIGVGDWEDVCDLSKGAVDDHFADKYIMPGLIEAHSHLHGGGLWQFCYVGFYDRLAPDGSLWTGLKSLKSVVDRLKAVETEMTDPSAPLLAWGFDPIYFSQDSITNRELDQVSDSRPVAIVHASFHLMNVNTPMLDVAGITSDTDIEGIKKHPDGTPTGELHEFAAMFPVNRAIGNAFRTGGSSIQGLKNFSSLSQIAGVTTATDLNNEIRSDDLQALTTVTEQDDFPIRLVPAYRTLAALGAIDEGIEKVQDAIKYNNPKLRFGPVKLTLDGSIQGFTARLQWPGYHNGHENGIWVTSPIEAMTLVEKYHAAGLQLHIHTNGDEATEVALDAIEMALSKNPRNDHRHTLQHVQMATPAQYRRMANLGVCVNLFCNHIYYWGDAHFELTMGPTRAQRMNACATAGREGVPFTMHSDAPITPIGPLFTAWCAVNRLTSTGRVLGEQQRISVSQALHAITLGAAYTLKMDHEVGSIEVGKNADFCILGSDPLLVNPEELKDIPIWGTVLSGIPFESPRWIN